MSQLRVCSGICVGKTVWVGVFSLGISLFWNAPAKAALTAFSSRASWEAAVGVGNFSTENLDALTPGTIPSNTSYDLGLLNVYYEFAPGGNDTRNAVVNPSLISSGNMVVLRQDTLAPDNTIVLRWEFDSPITVLGADWLNVDNITSSTLSLVLNNSAGTFDISSTLDNVSDATDGPGTGGNTSPGFAGFISTIPFTQATFVSSSATGDTFRFDDVSLGAPVPFEVNGNFGFLVLGLGLGASYFFRRSRSR